MTMMMMMKVDGALQKEMDERNLRPRLCYLTKGERGYGFHLHGERGSGAQFIRRIEAGSPAELAGLRSGDRVVEVNGENVEKESHHQVVQKIMEVENRTRLLVVDRETDEFLLLHSLPCTEDLAVEMSCLSSPRASSSSLASSTLSFTSSLRDSLTPSPSDSIALSPRDFATHSLSGTVTSLMLPQSTTSSPPGSSDPLPSDSIILSPQNSTPSPEDSINQSPYDSITQSPINPITESPSKPITQSPNNLDTQSLTNPITQSPYDSITHPPSDTITTPFSREKSDETHVMDDTGTTDNQVNGRNIEGLRHSEVVQIIRGGGEHARLLVVDPETDELFKKLDITPTPAHLNEDCVDGPLVDAPASTCPLKGSSASPPVIHSASPSQPPITDLDVIKPPIRNESLKQQSHGVSSRSITSETSVMTECNSAPGVQEVKLGKDLDPLWESGLRLSPTAAEARQKVSSKKANKRAPPMAWNKKYEIFCNF
ncbi:Na(+)/H(+) exchange regulatory cofactor NHE-RF2 isoform X3 [Hemibagrus wyckioides]|uniref:Na(+)/H(+) exchange regulatory cofactor NHE-RF2 isoform X3 n=1 Tax=Hemibagrus wyckioides TaxID=337641 RepID=UPI00266BCE7A|nr:Na(+)/H(+) exchange regulatory cofactor NHE-RF2 isoform X3 [Hemibagrus wyckioides]